MASSQLPVEWDQLLPDGLHYQERRVPDTAPRRTHCCIGRPGDEEALSELTLLCFRQRIGSVPIPSVGIAGVHTRPDQRGRGLVRRLFALALDRAAAHADAAFLFGIEDLYRKFGFETTLPATEIRVWIARTLDSDPEPSFDVAEGVDADQGAIMELYNRIHATRSWTRERSADTWRLRTRPSNWRPGNDVVCLRRRNGSLAAYGIWRGTTLGQHPRDYIVHEAGAEDVQAANVLLRELAGRAWQRRVDEMLLQEAPDSAVGQAARFLGCSVTQRFSPDGGGMSCFLRRDRVVQSILPELARRERSAGLGAGQEPSAEALQELEDSVLMRLLLGFWSWEDAAAMGTRTNHVDDRRLRAWFPVPGSSTVPISHAHSLDHY
jgi:hypothetical protein